MISDQSPNRPCTLPCRYAAPKRIRLHCFDITLYKVKALGRLRSEGGGGGVRTGPFKGRSHFKKREETLPAFAQICNILVCNSYQDTLFPESVIRPRLCHPSPSWHKLKTFSVGLMMHIYIRNTEQAV